MTFILIFYLTYILVFTWQKVWFQPQPTWTKKARRIDKHGFKKPPPEKKNTKNKQKTTKKTANFRKEGPQKIEMVSRKPIWAKKIPRID